MKHFFSPNSGEDQKKGLHQKWNQAHSQKFAIGGGLIFGFGAEPPVAEGQWGLGVWGQSPQRSKILHFFAKIA